MLEYPVKFEFRDPTPIAVFSTAPAFEERAPIPIAVLFDTLPLPRPTVRPFIRASVVVLTVVPSLERLEVFIQSIPL